MAGTVSSVEDIVKSHSEKHMKKMQEFHSGGDVGISIALFYPGQSDVPGFFGCGSAGPNLDVTADTIYAIGS